MKIIDLTHTISPDMPVYPGTEPPVIETGCAIDEIGFLEKKITFFSHTGTHIDAPAHLLKNGRTLDALPIDHFHGPAFLLNRADAATGMIGIEELTPHGAAIAAVDFLLFHTGWSRHWGTKRYFSGYPTMTAEAAEWLGGFRLKGIGLDTISADAADTVDFAIHKSFLSRDVIIIENLAHLDRVGADPFDLACFPLKFQDADGSPTRAVALIGRTGN